MGGDNKLSSPGGPCTTLSTTRMRFVKAFGQTFSVVFNIHFAWYTTVAVAAVAHNVLTLTHRYNAVRGHRTGFNK